jgi:hypothetical protein
LKKPVPTPAAKSIKVVPFESLKSAVRTPTRTARDAFTRWSEYYRTHKDSPRMLLETLSDWRRAIEEAKKNGEKKPTAEYAEIEGIIKAYLTFHGKFAEPWMYEQLAVAIEFNQGPRSEVKESLDWAADLSLRREDPNAMLSVVDLLMLRNYGDLAGPPGREVAISEIIKKVADKVPHRGEPLLMGIELAKRRRDADFMAWNVDRLLSLGWMGIDDEVRKRARTAVEELAENLKAQHDEKEASVLLDRLKESMIRDLVVRLTWKGYADLDLLIDEPLGATACYMTPRTVFGGAMIKNGYGKHPEEVYVCPRGFDGVYTIRIDIVVNDAKKNPASDIQLETILHEGAANEVRKVYSIDPRHIKPIEVTLQGGRRKTAMPFIAPVNIDALTNKGIIKHKPVDPKKPTSASSPLEKPRSK